MKGLTNLRKKGRGPSVLYVRLSSNMGDIKSYVDEKIELVLNELKKSNARFNAIDTKFDAMDTKFEHQFATFQAQTLSMITNMRKNERSSSSPSLIDNTTNINTTTTTTVAAATTTTMVDNPAMMDPTLRWTNDDGNGNNSNNNTKNNAGDPGGNVINATDTVKSPFAFFMTFAAIFKSSQDKGKSSRNRKHEVELGLVKPYQKQKKTSPATIGAKEHLPLPQQT